MVSSRYEVIRKVFRNNGKDELYDLIKDPRDRRNIIDEERETAERFWEKIRNI